MRARVTIGTRLERNADEPTLAALRRMRDVALVTSERRVFSCQREPRLLVVEAAFMQRPKIEVGAFVVGVAASAFAFQLAMKAASGLHNGTNLRMTLQAGRVRRRFHGLVTGFAPRGARV